GPKMIERSSQRFHVYFPGTLAAYDEGPHVIRWLDLSRNGCRIENTVPVVPGMKITLFLIPPGEDMPILIHDAMVRWAKGNSIGIEFHSVADHHRGRLDLLINQLKKSHQFT